MKVGAVVPAAVACPVRVTGAVRRVLIRRARGQKTAYRDKIRARIVLRAAERQTNTGIAAELGITVDTVRAWRGRFAEHGLAGLKDRPRSGRPSRFSAVQVAQVTSLACQLPAQAGAPLARWSCPELARETVAQGVVEAISAATVRRWLARDAIKPWQYRSWVFPRDLDFTVKAERVLDLYERRWNGKKLDAGEYVISSDEKTSIQARCRCHPTLPPGKARMMRINHEYERGGALAYLAAYDVHQARVFGHCAPSTGIVPFMALVEQVMTSEPYATAKRGVLDRGQRILPPRPGRDRPAGQAIPQRGHGAHTDTCLVVEPGGDLLLGSATQSRVSQRLHRPPRSRTTAHRLRKTLQRHRAALPVEVHSPRPARSTRPDQSTRTTEGHHRTPDSRMINLRSTSETDHLATGPAARPGRSRWWRPGLLSPSRGKRSRRRMR
jgi:transposase